MLFFSCELWMNSPRVAFSYLIFVKCFCISHTNLKKNLSKMTEESANGNDTDRQWSLIITRNLHESGCVSVDENNQFWINFHFSISNNHQYKINITLEHFSRRMTVTKYEWLILLSFAFSPSFFAYCNSTTYSLYFSSWWGFVCTRKKT